MFEYAIVNALAFFTTSFMFDVSSKTEFLARLVLIIMAVYNSVEAAQFYLGAV